MTEVLPSFNHELPSLPTIGRTYFLNVIHESIDSSPEIWMQGFDHIQELMKSYGTRIPTREVFLKHPIPTYLNFDKFKLWNHEIAHLDFARKHGVSAQLYVSYFVPDRIKSLSTPWVALDIQQLKTVRTIRKFMGDFLEAPKAYGLAENTEQTIADYLLGRDHQHNIKQFILENA